jgi:hypothetical protein
VSATREPKQHELDTQEPLGVAALKAVQSLRRIFRTTSKSECKFALAIQNLRAAINEAPPDLKALADSFPIVRLDVDRFAPGAHHANEQGATADE